MSGEIEMRGLVHYHYCVMGMNDDGKSVRYSDGVITVKEGACEHEHFYTSVRLNIASRSEPQFDITKLTVLSLTRL
jgi:hypothetical protein